MVPEKVMEEIEKGGYYKKISAQKNITPSRQSKPNHNTTGAGNSCKIQ